MKKITTLFILLFAGFNSTAQFNLYWANNYSYTVTSGFSNEARKVATDASGNIFVLSDITSDLDSTNHVGPTQYYVILQKYSPAGNLLVQKHLNVRNMQVTSTYNYSSAFSLIVDASGSVYIGFNIYNAVGGNYDVQVMKYNNALTTAWTFKFSTPANETGVNIVLRGSATYLLFKSVSGANTSYSIVRCEPNFINSVPMYSFDTNIDVVNSITTTPSLNLFVTGYRLISGVKNVMTASINMSGNLKWKYTFNNNSVAGDDYGTKIIVGADGFLYVTGTSYLNALNGNDAMVLRYNAANGTRNAQLFLNYSQGSGNNDNGVEIASGTAGTVFMSATKGSSDIVVYKLNTTTGVTVNSFAGYKPTPQSYTSLTSITIADMKVASSNNVYVAGGVFGGSAAGNFGASYLARFGMSGGNFSVLGSTDVEGTNAENYETMSIAFDAPRNNLIRVRSFWSTNATHGQESIFIEDYSMGSLRISNSNQQGETKTFYPNPASDVIYFENINFTGRVELYDFTGRLVKSVSQVENSLDVSDLATGKYMMILNEGNSIKREILIVE